MMRGRRGGEAAWEKTQEEPGPRIFQTDWANPNLPGSAEAPGMAAAMGCSDKPHLCLKPGRTDWGTEISQGAGL